MNVRPKSETNSHCPLEIGDKVVWITDEANIDCTVKDLDTVKGKVYVALVSEFCLQVFWYTYQINVGVIKGAEVWILASFKNVW